MIQDIFRGCLKAALMLGLMTAASQVAAEDSARPFNGPYRGRNLDRVAFPIGGIGAGMYCLEGTGGISHVSVKNQMDFFNEPNAFAAICVLGEGDRPNVARVIEGPIPDWKYFGAPGTGSGGMGKNYGLPRFQQCEFLARFPFATIKLSDAAVPLDVELVGWSPFTPPDADASSLPVGALEYRFRNRSDQPCKAIFSFNTRNFLGNGSIGSIKGGFVLRAGGTDFAVFADGEKAVVDHCWFRGGWFDALSIAWNNIEQGTLQENPPVAGNAPGVSLGVPFELGPKEEKTIRLLTCWYTPNIDQYQYQCGPAFSRSPAKGTAPKQQMVSGFLGRQLVNTFGGDGLTGTLTSPEFTATKHYLHFLIGGGNFAKQTCVNLIVDGKVVQSAVGRQSERLAWATFDMAKLAGKKARIQIVDNSKETWGHILADHFIFSNEPIDALRTGSGNAIVTDPKRVVVLQDFEGKDYGDWVADSPVQCKGGSCSIEESLKKQTPSVYIPWYATKFKSIEEVATHWRTNYDDLRRRSVVFRDAFYDTTLPPEVVEAVAANLTILKSPTVLRQHDGRLWGYEGCGDSVGCCGGITNHVWNYVQSISHLFPSLERGLRQTEFNDGQNKEGAQTCHVTLPIRPSFDHVATDGQLGGIMKTYREWQILGDHKWLAEYWPRVRRSLDYIIDKIDPRRTGLLEEAQFNTYDVSYFGPNGHCGTFYLGALAAAIEMGTAVGDDVSSYRELLEKGRKRLETELFNGEYFFQLIMTQGLNPKPSIALAGHGQNFAPLDPNQQSHGYRQVVETINKQGPKYQYGKGCLSDGILGAWMAAVCGIETPLIDPVKVRSHLMAVYKHNLKHNLSTHANPQRPTFAMGNDGGLLLCTWPRGDKLLLPIVYSNEVWTGIEYQAASHLMMIGAVKEGLDVVRTARLRYDGVRRNPFNEYECGHWYARAMSSYALLQGMTGVRYDARKKTLYADAKNGDFRSFLCTNTGFGTVTLRNGVLSVEVKSGIIPVEKTVVKPR